MPKYDHKKIEAKWKKSWEKSKIYKTNDPGFAKATPDKPASSTDKPKYYVLDMFPYPSGAGLHVGHPKGYIATDIVARMKMMQGYNVLHPMGWDAFGLPAENYALKNKVHPATATAENIKVFKKQLGFLGFTYDWEREVNTTDPEYYKWTQWIFLQLFKKGLAFESYEPINWCPGCKTGLANEDLEDGKCERCGSAVEQKPMRQWVLKITDYAERLLNDIELLKEWPEPIKEMQRNWIGRSEGMLFSSPVKDTDIVIQTFNSHFEPFCADTFVVIAPDHPLLPKLVAGTSTEKEVLKKADEITKARAAAGYEDKEMDGIFTGRYTVDPVGNGELPIWVASYALANYGTGIVKCSAHDERDFAFAKKFGIRLKEVLEPLITKNTGEDAFREGEAISERNAVVAVIKHWSEDKYLGVEWKRTGWKGFVIGGINSDEDPVAAGFREIIEETGYQHPEFMESLGGTVHARFYQLVKNENRLAHFKPLLFKLKDGERGEIAAEETALHDLKWLTAEEMSNFITHEDMRIVWRRAQGNLCYTDMKNGILNEPAELVGPITKDTRGKIIKYLEENKLAVKKVNYKLRDWVFSRQRYWGEPIPLVHCEACKNKKYNYIILHGYTGTADKNGSGRGESNNWRPWVKLELEKNGHKVFCPNLPNTNEPNIDEQAQYIIDNVDFEINEDTIIVGHSLGGVVIYKLLEKLNKKVAKVLLVDPVVTPKFPDKEWPNVAKSCDWKFDFEKIKKLSDFIVLGASDFGTIFEKDLRFITEQLGAELVLDKPAEGHFTAEQEPKVLVLLTCTGWYPVPEKDLPLELPKVKNYEPTGTGESPLAGIDNWVNTKCSHCGGPAKRETNTMPQWAGSCWYYLRYEDPHNDKELVSKEKEKYWSPVDLYVGGAEHATRHLIYARFWHKFLYDIGAVANIEPFTKLQNVGLILAEDGRKMSKRWNNVINPDDIVAEFGADAMRLYEMFMGPFDQACAWSTKGVIGCRRFLEKVWNLSVLVIPTEARADEESPSRRDRDSSPTATGIRNDSSKLEILLNQTIKKVTEDIQAMRFNTAISQLMIFANETNNSPISDIQYQIFLQLLAPFAPHLAEELWSALGNKDSIFKSAWPQYNKNKIQSAEITIVIQVNGKVRDEMIVSADISEADAKARALASEKVQKWLEGKEPKKVIYVKGKLVSIVV